MVPVVVLVSACDRAPAVEGDLSLGATKGAYRTVVLVRNPADSVMAAIDGQCSADRADIQRRTDNVRTLEATRDRFQRTQGKTSIAQVALSDSAEKYRQAAREEQRALSERPDTAYRNNVALIRAATDTQVEADNKGHFRFAKRQKGTYLLYVEWTAATGDNEFLAPVDLSAGGKKTQNLDQATVSTRLRCR
jgi:hypothetical protein